ncbi:MAG: SDR family oxidoreductase [Actinomycetota bacterium]|nr:SDR family oxidoreductase [Actinomycetota bacterium]
MRILILGGDGMLGHRLLMHLQKNHETKVTLRRGLAAYERYGLFTRDNSYAGVEARDTDRMLEVVSDFRPEALVNAVGIVKQRGAAKEAIPSLEINSLLPHRLALLCKAAGAKLVHISTDCVFSGRRGNYTEEDVPDAEDLYGRTKLLGELAEPGCVTLRTSIIGLELSRRTGLIEWFLSQRGEIRGFTKAIYTGLTTVEMSRVIERVLLEHQDLSGVWHVASEPITKHDLLVRFSKILGRDDVSIVPDGSVRIDRSLSALAFEKVTGYSAPGWNEMLEELGAEVRQRQGEKVW